MQDLFNHEQSPQLAARVLVDGLQEMILDYAIPEEMRDLVQRGCRVEVHMRQRLLSGTILELSTPDPQWAYRLRPIVRLIDEKPVIPAKLMDLAEWAASYYAVPAEQMIRCMLPTAVRQEKNDEKKRKVAILQDWPNDDELNKINARAPRQAHILRYLHQSEEKKAPLSDLGGSAALAPCRALEKRKLIRIEEESVHRDPVGAEVFSKSDPLALNEGQQAALDFILEELNKEEKTPILLQGVTGSGKTEVYLQAAAQAIANGKGVLILVPEISLTPQTMARFKARFADDPQSVAILHSAMSDGERYDEWHSIRKGRARVAIGPRSAVFSPVNDLGLIIVDEEHDGSYKQENSPRYHARDLAILRAKMEGACIVLGSATPSLESHYNVIKKKYQLLRLDQRADGQQLPVTRVLDMRSEVKDKRFLGILSERLRAAIDDRLLKGEQVILLLNRRGFARSLQCEECGYVAHCEHCEMPMTYHLSENRLICHICGFRSMVASRCPSCSNADLKLIGFGTQKVETVLRRAFSQARLRRIDADVTSRKNALRDILADFRAHRIDILLGTQMISKGLDFPGVTLVGVLNADQGLNAPDFRAGERTFQLLTQVAGRAGRGELEGEVIIQTHSPHAPAIQYARRHDTDGFAEHELAMRQALQQPPYTHMAMLSTKSESESMAEFSMKSLHHFISKSLPEGVVISEPCPAPLPKAHSQYRFQCTLMATRARVLTDLATKAIRHLGNPEDVSISYDLDVYSFM